MQNQTERSDPGGGKERRKIRASAGYCDGMGVVGSGHLSRSADRIGKDFRRGAFEKGEKRA